jgi:hypothetical protein
LAFFVFDDPRRGMLPAAKQPKADWDPLRELATPSPSEPDAMVLSSRPAFCLLPFCLTGPPQYAACLLAAPECTLSQFTPFGSKSEVTKEKEGGGLALLRDGIPDDRFLVVCKSWAIQAWENTIYLAPAPSRCGQCNESAKAQGCFRLCQPVPPFLPSLPFFTSNLESTVARLVKEW